MTAIATVLFVKLLGPYGPTVATVVITVIVLIFGEITPKNIAKEKPESFGHGVGAGSEKADDDTDTGKFRFHQMETAHSQDIQAG